MKQKQLPPLYQKEIDMFLTFILNEFPDDKLKLIILTGSVAFHNVIENISDLDFFIVLDKPTQEDYKKIFSFKHNLNIKTDIIVNTKHEIDNLYLDYNCMYHLYLYTIGKIKPLYEANNFNIKIDIDTMKTFTKTGLFFNIRTLKRCAYDVIEDNQMILLKRISYVIKNYLVLQDIFPENIIQTINYFYDYTGIEYSNDIIKTLENKLNNDEVNELFSYINDILLYFDKTTL